MSSIFGNSVKIKTVTGVQYDSRSWNWNVHGTSKNKKKYGNVVFYDDKQVLKLPTNVYQILVGKGLTKNKYGIDIEDPKYYILVLGIILLHEKTFKNKHTLKYVTAAIKRTRKDPGFKYNDSTINATLRFMVEDIAEVTHSKRNKVAYYATLFAHNTLDDIKDYDNLISLIATYDDTNKICC